MKLKFTTEATRDFDWFTRYYAMTFPEGRRNAERQLVAILQLLAENPSAGRKSDGVETRQIPVSKTPFLIIYRTSGDTLQVLRIWDARRRRPNRWDTPE